MRVVLCLVTTLQLGACAMPHHHADLSQAEQPPVAQTVDLALPSAPVPPKAAPVETIAYQDITRFETRSNCQIGFEDIMTQAAAKIQTQRHM